MITDHEHVRTGPRPGRWSLLCGQCRRPNSEHLSWGRVVAQRIGGRPTDYVRRPR